MVINCLCIFSGTGKSETGAHIAYVMAVSNPKNKCVLYCGPTNKSVDVVLGKLYLFNTLCMLLCLHDTLHFTENLQNLCSITPMNILRVYGHAIEKRDYPGPFCNKGAYQISDSDYNLPIWARSYALHWKIRESSTETSTKLKELEQMFKVENEKGHISSARAYEEWKTLVEICEERILQQHFHIVLCTCNEASSNRIRKNLHVQQCIIDESGMAYEPEAIGPISLCEHVVLLGDHKQLQPVIEYKPARENGLTTSLFERYAKSKKYKIHTMLDIQYRMVSYKEAVRLKL